MPQLALHLFCAIAALLPSLYPSQAQDQETWLVGEVLERLGELAVPEVQQLLMVARPESSSGQQELPEHFHSLHQTPVPPTEPFAAGETNPLKQKNRGFKLLPSF